MHIKNLIQHKFLMKSKLRIVCFLWIGLIVTHKKDTEKIFAPHLFNKLEHGLTEI